MTGEHLGALLLVAVIAGGVTYYATVRFLRKLEDFGIPLWRWFDYDAPQRQARGQHRAQIHAIDDRESRR